MNSNNVKSITSKCLVCDWSVDGHIHVIDDKIVDPKDLIKDNWKRLIQEQVLFSYKDYKKIKDIF